jgi:hypothetical protein
LRFLKEYTFLLLGEHLPTHANEGFNGIVTSDALALLAA